MRQRVCRSEGKSEAINLLEPATKFECYSMIKTVAGRNELLDVCSRRIRTKTIYGCKGQLDCGCRTQRIQINNRDRHAKLGDPRDGIRVCRIERPENKPHEIAGG